LIADDRLIDSVAAVLSLLALGSSAVWGTSDFLAGLLSRRLPAAAVVGWSQGIALLALSLVVVGRGGLEPEWGWLGWGLLAGASGATGLVSFYAALAGGTMGVVAPIASLGVVVPVGLGLATGDQPPTLAWAGMAVAIVGVTLASGPELSGAVSPRPVVLAGVAAAGFGVALFALDRGARVSTLDTLWAMRLISVLAFSAAALRRRTMGGVRRGDLPMLAVIGLGDLSANVLFAVASSRGQVSLASVLASLYPVVTVLLARGVLHERLRTVQKAGVALCMVGAAAVAA
jgi:drug/metabolite transporter (DMT)-like permease